MPALRVFAARSLCGLVLCLPAVPQQTTPPAQPAAPSGQPTVQFKGSATEVIVPVTVTDDKGRFVSNLVKPRTSAFWTRASRRTSSFSATTRSSPIVVGFLIDLSNNIAHPLEDLPGATQELVWNLLPGDKRYTRLPDLLRERRRDCGQYDVGRREDRRQGRQDEARRRRGAVRRHLHGLHPRDLVKGEPYEPRRIIIVIGDGHDNASNKPGRGSGTGAAQPGDDLCGQHHGLRLRQRRRRDVLERLRTETGGHVEYPLNALYKDVSGYLSNPPDAATTR